MLVSSKLTSNIVIATNVSGYHTHRKGCGHKMHEIVFVYMCYGVCSFDLSVTIYPLQGPLLLPWINFNPKFHRLHVWSLEMNKEFHPTRYNKCNYLSMLGLKLNNLSNIGSRESRRYEYSTDNYIRVLDWIVTMVIVQFYIWQTSSIVWKHKDYFVNEVPIYPDMKLASALEMYISSIALYQKQYTTWLLCRSKNISRINWCLTWIFYLAYLLRKVLLQHQQ